MTIAATATQSSNIGLTPVVTGSSTPSVATVRVLHILNGEFYAGAERVLDLLAQRLPAYGYEVGFACLRPKAFDGARKAKQVPLYSANMHGKFDLRPAWELANVVRTQGYDLIHTHTARSALIGRIVSRLSGVPMVHHIHSPAACDTTHRWSNRANVWLERTALPHAKGIIAVSSSMGRYAREMGLSHSRVIVIPNGVPTPGLLLPCAAPTGRWTLGMVALFRPRKGLEVLLDALAMLADRGHDVHLRAVGTFDTPAYQQEILARVDRLELGKRIEWRGFQQNVDAELAEMDLFVLPSLFGEGMPMVLLEAMAAGVPIVSTRVEGVPEAVRDGVDGLLIEPGDPASLAWTINQYLEGHVDWNAIRASAYEQQSQRFSDRSMAESVAQVYDAVLADRPPVHAVARRVSPVAEAIEPCTFNVLGVKVTDLSFEDGVNAAAAMMADRSHHTPCDVEAANGTPLIENAGSAPIMPSMMPTVRPQVLYFANAHTLNCACEVPGFREVMDRADAVYGDGTGVRWAARLQGIRLRANLNGTDLIPAVFDAAAGLGYRYYLLGSDPVTIECTVEVTRKRFPSWELCGYHHGYLTPDSTADVIDEINQQQPHLLLIGMGNPLQEQWIDKHRDALNVRLVVGVGGLLDYLAGRNIRAPRLFRGLGLEWFFVAFTQPRKFWRYALGNPKFLWRIVRERWNAK